MTPASSRIRPSYRPLILGVLIILGISIVALQLVSFHSNKQMQTQLAQFGKELRLQQITLQAQNITRIYLSSPYNVSERLCIDNSSPACTMTKVKLESYPNMGQHKPLWVAVAGVHELNLANLPATERQAFARAQIDFTAALSMYGIYEIVLASQDKDPSFSTTLITRTLEAHALACQQITDLPCKGGLPVPVATSLRALLQFTAENGPKYHANNTKPHLGAIHEMLTHI